MSPRVLLTISRTWTRWSQVRETLTTIHAKWPDAVLVHGAHPKCDGIAAGMWRDMGGQHEPWPAQWKRFGKGAGMIRNERMVQAGADLCVAFIRDGSAGASHCAAAAEAQGISTWRFTDDSEEVAS